MSNYSGVSRESPTLRGSVSSGSWYWSNTELGSIVRPPVLFSIPIKDSPIHDKMFHLLRRGESSFPSQSKIFPPLLSKDVAVSQVLLVPKVLRVHSHRMRKAGRLSPTIKAVSV